MQKFWIRILFIVAILILWEVSVILDGRLEKFPHPVGVWEALFRIGNERTLWVAVTQSLTRVLIAFVIAFILGVVFGIVLGSFTILDRALSPIIDALRSIAPIAWIPMAVMWLGITGKAAIFIVAYAAVFPIILNTYHAVRMIDRSLIHAARTLGASKLLLVYDVMFKSALPNIIVGARISMGFAWASIIAAELAMGIKIEFGSKQDFGLGQLMVNTLFIERDINALVLYMLTIGVVGFGIDYFMRVVRRLSSPWALL